MDADQIKLTSIPHETLKIEGKEADLLENYAGLAMQALISKVELIKSDENYNYDAIAEDAFQFAFAMMRRRNEYNR